MGYLSNEVESNDNSFVREGPKSFKKASVSNIDHVSVSSDKQKAKYYKPTLESHNRIGASKSRQEKGRTQKLENRNRDLISDQLSSFEIDDDIHKVSKISQSNNKIHACNTLRYNVDISNKPEINRIRSSIVKSKRELNAKSTKAVSIVIEPHTVQHK